MQESTLTRLIRALYFPPSPTVMDCKESQAGKVFKELASKV